MGVHIQREWCVAVGLGVQRRHRHLSLGADHAQRAAHEGDVIVSGGQALGRDGIAELRHRAALGVAAFESQRTAQHRRVLAVDEAAVGRGELRRVLAVHHALVLCRHRQGCLADGEGLFHLAVVVALARNSQFACPGVDVVLIRHGVILIPDQSGHSHLRRLRLAGVRQHLAIHLHVAVQNGLGCHLVAPGHRTGVVAHTRHRHGDRTGNIGEVVLVVGHRVIHVLRQCLLAVRHHRLPLMGLAVEGHIGGSRHVAGGQRLGLHRHRHCGLGRHIVAAPGQLHGDHRAARVHDGHDACIVHRDHIGIAALERHRAVAAVGVHIQREWCVAVGLGVQRRHRHLSLGADHAQRAAHEGDVIVSGGQALGRDGIAELRHRAALGVAAFESQRTAQHRRVLAVDEAAVGRGELRRVLAVHHALVLCRHRQGCLADGEGLFHLAVVVALARNSQFACPGVDVVLIRHGVILIPDQSGHSHLRRLRLAGVRQHTAVHLHVAVQNGLGRNGEFLLRRAGKVPRTGNGQRVRPGVDLLGISHIVGVHRQLAHLHGGDGLGLGQSGVRQALAQRDHRIADVQLADVELLLHRTGEVAVPGGDGQGVVPGRPAGVVLHGVAGHLHIAHLYGRDVLGLLRTVVGQALAQLHLRVRDVQRVDDHGHAAIGVLVVLGGNLVIHRVIACAGERRHICAVLAVLRRAVCHRHAGIVHGLCRHGHVGGLRLAVVGQRFRAGLHIRQRRRGDGVLPRRVVDDLVSLLRHQLAAEKLQNIVAAVDLDCEDQPLLRPHVRGLEVHVGDGVVRLVQRHQRVHAHSGVIELQLGQRGVRRAVVDSGGHIGRPDVHLLLFDGHGEASADRLMVKGRVDRFIVDRIRPRVGEFRHLGCKIGVHDRAVLELHGSPVHRGGLGLHLRRLRAAVIGQRADLLHGHTRQLGPVNVDARRPVCRLIVLCILRRERPRRLIAALRAGHGLGSVPCERTLHRLSARRHAAAQADAAEGLTVGDGRLIQRRFAGGDQLVHRIHGNNNVESNVVAARYHDLYRTDAFLRAALHRLDGQRQQAACIDARRRAPIVVPAVQVHEPVAVRSVLPDQIVRRLAVAASRRQLRQQLGHIQRIRPRVVVHHRQRGVHVRRSVRMVDRPVTAAARLLPLVHLRSADEHIVGVLQRHGGVQAGILPLLSGGIVIRDVRQLVVLAPHQPVDVAVERLDPPERKHRGRILVDRRRAVVLLDQLHLRALQRERRDGPLLLGTASIEGAALRRRDRQLVVARVRPGVAADHIVRRVQRLAVQLHLHVLRLLQCFMVVIDGIRREHHRLRIDQLHHRVAQVALADGQLVPGDGRPPQRRVALVVSLHHREHVIRPADGQLVVSLIAGRLLAAVIDPARLGLHQLRAGQTRTVLQIPGHVDLRRLFLALVRRHRRRKGQLIFAVGHRAALAAAEGSGSFLHRIGREVALTCTPKVGRFHQVIAVCQQIGRRYRDIKAALQPAALQRHLHRLVVGHGEMPQPAALQRQLALRGHDQIIQPSVPGLAAVLDGQRHVADGDAPAGRIPAPIVVHLAVRDLVPVQVQRVRLAALASPARVAHTADILIQRQRAAAGQPRGLGLAVGLIGRAVHLRRVSLVAVHAVPVLDDLMGAFDNGDVVDAAVVIFKRGIVRYKRPVRILEGVARGQCLAGGDGHIPSFTDDFSICAAGQLGVRNIL